MGLVYRLASFPLASVGEFTVGEFTVGEFTVSRLRVYRIPTDRPPTETDDLNDMSPPKGRRDSYPYTRNKRRMSRVDWPSNQPTLDCLTDSLAEFPTRPAVPPTRPAAGRTPSVKPRPHSHGGSIGGPKDEPSGRT